MEYLTKTEFVDRRVGDRRASVVPKADARAATLLQLGPVATFLDAEDTIEVSVNRAGEVLVETRKGWLTHALPELDFVRLERLAIAVTMEVNNSGGLFHRAGDFPSLRRIDFPIGRRGRHARRQIARRAGDLGLDILRRRVDVAA